MADEILKKRKKNKNEPTKEKCFKQQYKSQWCMLNVTDPMIALLYITWNKNNYRNVPT